MANDVPVVNANLEKLYKAYETLSAVKDNFSEHEAEYLQVLQCEKADDREKGLASQIIVRFFKNFPDHLEQAINAYLDILEDGNIEIRKQAIRSVPSLCKGNSMVVQRFADVLAQLLQTDDDSENKLVQSSLVHLMKFDAKASLEGLFNQVLTGEELIRTRTISFLANSIKHIPEETWKPDLQNYIIDVSNKVLDDVTGEEFVLFMKILSVLPQCQTVQGRQKLLDMIVKQAELDTEFIPTEADNVDRLIQCTKQVMPFLSKNVHGDKFIVYFLTHVLPSLGQISQTPPSAAPDSPASTDPVDVRLDLLKVFTELSAFVGPSVVTADHISKIFNALLQYLPLPPAHDPLVTAAAATSTTNGDEKTVAGEATRTAAAAPEMTDEEAVSKTSIEYSYVECLLYLFHLFARRHPAFLQDSANEERLKDFRKRLQFVGLCVRTHTDQLRAALKTKSADELKKKENRIKVVWLKTTTGIQSMIKDLMHNPPSYKTTIRLSWKPLKRSSSVSEDTPKAGGTAAAAAPDTKKAAPEPTNKVLTSYTGGASGGTGGGGAGNKTTRQDRAIYAPPTGTFSDKAGVYQESGGGYGGGYRGGRWRGGGGGGWRGGYRGGNNWNRRGGGGQQYY